jgi:hypothetical protein
MRFAFVAMALGMSYRATGAENLSAPDLVASRIEAQLQGKYQDDHGLDRAVRVLEIEKRIGAYRAAQSRAAFVYRINADLRVATRDDRICVSEQSVPAVADAREYDLGTGFKLIVPVTSTW